MSDPFKEFQNPDGKTYDGAAALASLTGISKQSIVEIAAAVKVNAARLKGCPGHQFLPAQGRKRVCAHCMGEADVHSVHWYEEGRRHEREAAS